MSLWSLLNVWSHADRVKVYRDGTKDLVCEGRIEDLREDEDISRYYNSIVTYLTYFGRGAGSAIVFIA